jgi:hypothetical protein
MNSPPSQLPQSRRSLWIALVRPFEGLCKRPRQGHLFLPATGNKSVGGLFMEGNARSLHALIIGPNTKYICTRTLGSQHRGEQC